MKRRNFIKTTALGTLAIGIGSCSSSKTHILTFSWDDGFKKSFYHTAGIFERYNLKACLNVIASGHLTAFNTPNEYHADERGNFNDWNALRKRGHEIMPHSWSHQNLTEIPVDMAKGLIDKCLNYFDEHLDDFEASESVYNFAYNASTPELEEYTLTKVRAIRTGSWNILGDIKTNPFPSKNSSMRLSCSSFGPDNADNWVEEEINNFLKSEGGWLILNLHGLDEEGWGPVSSEYLKNLLKRLVEFDYLDILPAGEVLKKYIS
ncbi:MAG: polysaccharide deacetylase family protein [Bacteroidota bacterium]